MRCPVGCRDRERAIRGVHALHRSGGDLLSHVLRRSTIGAAALNGRVRDGIGCFARAVATRPVKRTGCFPVPRDLVFPVVTDAVVWVADFRQERRGERASLLPDRIKSIGRLVPVN